jgi:hypothetical protein
MAAPKKVKQFEILDTADTTKWDRFLVLQAETTGVKMEKPSLSKTPGARLSGRIMSHVTLKGGKGTVEKYVFVVSGLFKDSDNDGSVAEFRDPMHTRINRLHSHKMSQSERDTWTLVNKKPIGLRQYTELKVVGHVPIKWLQILEFTTFKEIFAGGQRLKKDMYVTLQNFRWEEKFGGERDYVGFKNDSATEFEPRPFERIEVLSQIAHGWGDYQCLWATAETLRMEYPKEIDDDMKETGIDKTSALNDLKRLKRSHQATESQKDFFFTAICMPVKASNPKSPVANHTGKLFTALNIEVETGGNAEEKGGLWATVRGDRFLMQPNAEGEEEVVGIHLEFARTAIDALGIRNPRIKKAMTPMMFAAMDSGKIWCEVDYLASTETTAVPKSEDRFLAAYPLYFNCVHLEFNRAAMIRTISIPITAMFTKFLWNMKLLQDVRDAFSANHPLVYGDDIYNASEFQAPLDMDEYDYVFSHPKLTIADINRLKRICREKNWTPEQSAEEISKWFAGKAGPAGEVLFAESCTKLEFNAETPAILWGIRKTLKVEEEDQLENEGMLLRMYHDWTVNGIEPQLPDGKAPLAIEDRSEASEAGDGEKRRKGKGTKRVKKDAVQLKD